MLYDIVFFFPTFPYDLLFMLFLWLNIASQITEKNYFVLDWRGIITFVCVCFFLLAVCVLVCVLVTVMPESEYKIFSDFEWLLEQEYREISFPGFV